MKKSKKLKRDLAYAGIKLLIVLFKLTPDIFIFSLARFFSRVVCLLWRGTTRTIIENAKKVFRGMDTNELKEAVREVYSNTIVGAFEVIKAYYRFPNRFYFRVEGEEHLRYALRKKGNVMWVSAHYGNWELLPLYFSFRGYSIAVVARRLYDERVNRLVEGFRTKFGIKVVYREKGNEFKLIRAMMKYEITGFLVDQRIKDVDNIPSTFLGVSALTPVGFAIIAKRLKIPIVVGVSRREKPFHHLVLISEPLFPEDKTESEIVDWVNARISEFVFSNPWQWMWFHKRWD